MGNGFALSAINIPQAAICAALALPQTSLAWSFLVAVLSPAGLVGARLAPIVLSKLGFRAALKSTSVFFVVAGGFYLTACHLAAGAAFLVCCSSCVGRGGRWCR